MSESRQEESPTEWTIDLPGRLATHVTGLVILMSPDALYAEKWTGRCLNARLWADEDMASRSLLLPRLLRTGVATFTRELRQSAGRPATALSSSF